MCGIVGIYGHKDAARLTYLGLYALQHRGEESAGIRVSMMLSRDEFCTACFNGNYPVKHSKRLSKNMLEK